MVTAKSDEIVEIHASSGTTGNPIIGAYTKSDMDMWQELMARSIYTTGGRRQDVIHIAYGYGLFTGGLGFHYGAQKVGAKIVPASGGMTQRQIKLMKDLGRHHPGLHTQASRFTLLKRWLKKALFHKKTSNSDSACSAQNHGQTKSAKESKKKWA